MKTTYTLLAGLVAQQAAATWNLSGKPFSSPQYANNECSDKQKGGFDWSDLKDGDSNFQYGDFDFSKNWKCSNSVGKRDLLTKRTFGNKAIKNKCSKQQPATFGCDKRKNGFSITTIDVSVEFDVEIDLHYTMTDGSLCKQKQVPCKKDGSTIQNTQCGGAKSVDVYLGSRYQGEKSDCEIGLHHIGFDCDAPTPYKPVPPPQVQTSKPAESSKPAATTPPAKSSKAVVSTPPAESSKPATTAPPAESSAVVPPPGPPGPPYAFSSLAPYANSSIPATRKTTKVPPTTLQSSTATPLAESSTAVPPPSKESSVASCNGGYGQSCDTSSALPSPPPAMSTGVAPPSPPPAQASTPSYPPSALPPKEVGDVLPTCMNTWLQISTEDCKDNTATDCYCKNAKFTKNVIDCVQAWCETDEQTKKTLQYLVGICAEHVPENPGLVTDCPKDTFDNTPPTPTGGAQVPSSGMPANTPMPSAPPAVGVPPAHSAPPAPSAPPANVPMTTITYGTTSLTVPQVHFTTEVPAAGSTPTAPVGLVPGVAPPQTPAGETPVATAPAAGAPYPIPSTLRPTTVLPTASGTGAFRPSSPAQFTGAASPFKAEAKHVMLGAALAFLVL
jgi:hypothetical protein